MKILVEEAIMRARDPMDAELADSSHPPDEVARLRDKLKEAVRNEHFERAADLKKEIRDTIRTHEESVDGLDEAIDARLRRAYEGTRAMEESDDD